MYNNVGFIIIATKEEDGKKVTMFAAEDSNSGGYIYFTEYLVNAKLFTYITEATKFKEFWDNSPTYLHGFKLEIKRLAYKV